MVSTTANGRGILREKILAMKELWTQDEASFSGKHVNFEKSWAWAPNRFRSRIPRSSGVGRRDPKTAAHIAEFCDGWLPLGGTHDFSAGWKAISEACANIERDPASLQISMFYAGGFKPEMLAQDADKGAIRAILPLPSEGADKVLPMLDKYAKHLG